MFTANNSKEMLRHRRKKNIGSTDEKKCGEKMAPNCKKCWLSHDAINRYDRSNSLKAPISIGFFFSRCLPRFVIPILSMFNVDLLIVFYCWIFFFEHFAR